MDKLSNMLKAQLSKAFICGFLLLLLYKSYTYISNREQYEDSNLLVTAIILLVATCIFYLLLKISSGLKSLKLK